MKNILTILVMLIGIGSYAQCGPQLLDNAVKSLSDGYYYQKDVKIKLKKSKKNKPPYMIKQNIVLNAGQQYQIYSKNAKEYDGRIIYELYNTKGVLGRSYAKGKHYKGIAFTCKKTGIYTMSCYYEGGKEGCSVIIVSSIPAKHELDDYLGN